MNIRNEGSSPAGTESPYVAFHQQDWIPEFYDEVVYQPGGYDDHSWRMLQRPMLERVVAAMPQRQIRCLDFACGTGRILSAVEPLVAKIVGIDTSEQMLSKARARGTSARLFCTDILIDESAAREKYDLITAYRFFLNTEPELRARVMEKLASMLDGPDARLVFNVHGHVPQAARLASRKLNVDWRDPQAHRRRRAGSGRVARFRPVPESPLSLVARGGVQMVRPGGRTYQVGASVEPRRGNRL